MKEWNQELIEMNQAPHKIGLELAKALALRKDRKGYYRTAHGPRTAIGIYNLVSRIQEENI